MIANYEKSKEEQEATVRMFCTYCWKSLLNARKDIARRQERRAKRVRLFCDMRESELNRLTCPACGHCFESLFDVGGVGVTVADPDMADAIRALDADGQAIVLLHYFAEWPDGRIGTHLGIPRSTVQFRRNAALRLPRDLLEGRCGQCPTKPWSPPPMGTPLPPRRCWNTSTPPSTGCAPTPSSMRAGTPNTAWTRR